MNLTPLLYLLLMKPLNRAKSGLGKLRKPKYILSMILVLGYLGFMIFSMLMNRLFIEDEPPVLGARALDSFIPLAMMLAASFYWMIVMAHRLHPLGFDQAEAELLFPLPIPRRTLIVYRLLAPLPLMFLSSLILTALFLSRLDPLAFLGTFIILNILRLHEVVIAFARSTPRASGLARVGFAWLPLLLLNAALALALIVSPPSFARILEGNPLPELERMTTQGLFPLVLLPFQGLARLLVGGQDLALFAVGIAWGTAVLALQLFWIFAQDVAFEEAALKGAETQAKLMEAVKKGGTRGLLNFWRGKNRKETATQQPFLLAPKGHPAVAFLWKGIIAGGRWYRPRNLVMAGFALWGSGYGLRMYAQTFPAEPAELLAIGLSITATLAWLIIALILFGQSQEGLSILEAMTLYKPLPLPGIEVVLGGAWAEWALGVIHYFFLGCLATGYMLPELQALDWVLVLRIAATALTGSLLLALVILIRMNLVMWLPFTARTEVGPAALGHNLIVGMARGLALLVTLILPGLVGLVLGFTIHAHPLAFPIILAACALIVAVEVVGLLLLGGWLYDRFDFAAEA